MSRHHSNRKTFGAPTSVCAPAFVVVSPLLQDEEWFDNEIESPAGVLGWDESFLAVDPAATAGGAKPVPAHTLTAAVDVLGSASFKRRRRRTIDDVASSSSQKRKVNTVLYEVYGEGVRTDGGMGAVSCCCCSGLPRCWLCAFLASLVSLCRDVSHRRSWSRSTLLSRRRK